MNRSDSIKKEEITGLSTSPPLPISIGKMLWNKTGSWRYLRPRYENKVPPCTDACPSGEYIERQIRLVQQGKVIDAWKLLREENPFPAICGRVCFHPCEYSCNRKTFDSPVSINAIERFIGDKGIEYGQVEIYPIIHKEKIGIIGSGPAGLSCSFFLRKLGYETTVFEANPKIGGLLRYGIPEFRLPKSVLDEEISLLLRSGVTVETGVKVGYDLPLSEMRQRFDAVFIAAGAQKSRKMGIPGEELEGVLPALEFLRRINAGMNVDVGKRVIVIGGGNTAIDAATVALRLGAKVSIFYRRTGEEMPAFEKEVQSAEEEGVDINFLVSPVRIERGTSMRLKVYMRRMTLGEPDESGRRRPIPIPGSDFPVETDSLLTAIGEEPDFSFLDNDIAVEKGLIVTNEDLSTSVRMIFAGGDIALNERSVTHAIGSGKKAAIAIDAIFRGKVEKFRESSIGKGFKPSMKLYTDERDGLSDFNRRKVVEKDWLNLDYFVKEERIEREETSALERIRNFEEFQKGLNEDEIGHEAARCFHCGNCTECDNCYIYCPDMSVRKKNGTYFIDLDYCKGCGLCAAECPRSVIVLEEEERIET